MPEEIKVGNVVVKRGELKKGYIDGVELNNGLKVDIPVLVANGAEDGETLLLMSTEHGNEIAGIEVILQIMNAHVDPMKLSGVVIGIPVANPTGFMGNRGSSWVDNRDVFSVNADMPGGSSTATIAYNLWKEAVSKADIWISMHGNVDPDALPFTSINTSDPETKEKHMALAKAFGYTMISINNRPMPSNASPNYKTLAWRQNKVVKLTVETPYMRWFNEKYVSTGIRGCLNVMKLRGMIEGEIEPQPDDLPYFGLNNTQRGVIRPRRGGLVRIIKKPGEPLKEGDVVAEVFNLFGDVVEELKMPHDGYIWAYPCGEFSGSVGEMQTVNTGCVFAYTFTHEGD